MTQSAIAARLRAQLPFLLAGLFAMGWIVTRALIQSITIDEADTYVYFASGKIHNQWTPHSNNHVLNTVLIHLFTSLFGLNNFAMRLPAMIGAAFYITSAYRLCTLITARLALAWPLFVCLILNPFIMDYLVAARGYSLALGFLMTALLLVCRLFISDGFSEPAIYRQCAYISACLGISFTANFSFAFVDIYTFALFAVILIPSYRNQLAPSADRVELFKRYGKLAGACVLPGFTIVLFIGLWTLLRFPRNQLVYGSNSVSEMWQVMIAATFYELNPNILNPLLIKWLSRWTKALPMLLIAAGLVQAAEIAVKRTSWLQEAATRRLVLVGSYFSAIALLTFLTHWTAFHLAGILLPKDRTSIYFEPLLMLALGTAAAVTIHSRLKQTLMRPVTIVLLFVGAVYFTGCLRLTYFQNWRYDADIKETYEALTRAVGVGNNQSIPCHFVFTSALNYYREYFHDGSFSSFWQNDNPRLSPGTRRNPYPPDKPAYVLYMPQDEDYIAQQHLKIVYWGKVSGVVIGVRQP